MLRTALVALWICALTAGSTFGAYQWKIRQRPPAPTEEVPAKPEEVKVKPITVPVIRGGALKGYVSVEFSYVTEKPDKHSGHSAPGITPDVYVMDEAFQRIYADNKLDFPRVDKFDLGSLAKDIKRRVNERMSADLVKEVLIRSLVYVPVTDSKP